MRERALHHELLGLVRDYGCGGDNRVSSLLVTEHSSESLPRPSLLDLQLGTVAASHVFVGRSSVTLGLKSIHDHMQTHQTVVRSNINVETLHLCWKRSELARTPLSVHLVDALGVRTLRLHSRFASACKYACQLQS